MRILRIFVEFSRGL